MSTDPSPLRYFGIVEESREARLLRLLLETVVQAVGGDEGSLLVHEPEAGDLRFAMTVGSNATERALFLQRVPLGAKSVVGLAAATHDVQIGAPVYTDVHKTELRDQKSTRPEVVIAAPLLSDDQLLGVITAVSFNHEKRFGTAEAQLCGRLATVAAVLIEQHQKLAAAEKAVPAATGALNPEAALRLEEISRALYRIAARQPAALAQVGALVASVEAALALTPPQR
jgi:GAF domain-containing protein